jgi:antitoxin component YwqK of YwqJK toxin-antitoxin module
MARFFIIFFSGFFLFANAQPAKNKTVIYLGDTINVKDNKGLKQGVWMKFYKTDTVFSKGQFKNDKPFGTFYAYYPSGKINFTRIYDATGRKSIFKSYYENGKLKLIGYYNLQNKDSIWKYYGETDSLVATEFYKNGQEYGEWVVYYLSGRKAEILQYQKGKRNGFSKNFLPMENLKLIVIIRMIN